MSDQIQPFLHYVSVESERANEDEMISAGLGSDDCTGMWNYVNFDKKHLFHIEILIIALIIIIIIIRQARREPCALLHTASGRQVFQRKTEKKN